MLAQRLRSLREHHWPEKVTQSELAQAFGGRKPISVPLISSWESLNSKVIIPSKWVDAYATFFATGRSLSGDSPRLLKLSEMTETERQAREDLRKELLALRNNAQRAITEPPSTADHPATLPPAASKVASGLWHFPDGAPITIVCAQVPEGMLKEFKYANPRHPDFIKLYTYADLDSLFELFGHIRAANPGSQVNLVAANQLASDVYTTHLVVLGGVDWNKATRQVLGQLSLPVRQVTDWDAGVVPYFEVVVDGKQIRHKPLLDNSANADGEANEPLLRADVALFARAVNPYNTLRTVTVCNGMYGNGTYGAVRALTDAEFRDRNNTFVRDNFGDKKEFCILTRVKIEDSVAVTPDWNVAGTVLFQWGSES